MRKTNDYFFGGFEFVIIAIILIAILAGSANTIISMLNCLFWIFAIKNVIQTVFFGCFKNRNSLAMTAGFLAIDVTRIGIFFYNLREIGVTSSHSSGLNYFFSLFGFLCYFLICGCIFLLGEFYS